MDLTAVDLLVFVAFMGTVIAVSLYAGRKEKSKECSLGPASKAACSRFGDTLAKATIG